MTQRKIALQEGWLHLPVRRDAPGHYVRLTSDGETLTELYLTLSETPDFYCAMDLTRLAGREVTLTSETLPQALMDAILPGGPLDGRNPLYAGLYREPLRPQYHFSSRRGWLNDPNGLFFDGSLYHLFYQHNPYATTHGSVNIGWGHATSPDGVRWTQRPEAIQTLTSTDLIASGSCIIDREGVAGYGKGAVIAAFTRLGTVDYHVSPHIVCPSLGQYLAYSQDGGDTFTLFPDNPAIPTQDGKDWRDPRLFEHPDGGFGAAVYETNERGNCVSFYHSDDLHHWTRTSRADDLYECPDLFRLTPVNGGEPKWVLYGADGMVRVGEFREGAFLQEGEKQPLDYGSSTYAGQTWNHHDDSEGRMHISWLLDARHFWNGNAAYPDMPFSQCMTVACLLTLERTPEGYRLRRNPVPAVDSLRQGEGDEVLARLATKVCLLPCLSGDLDVEVRAESTLRVQAGRVWFTYDPQTGLARFEGGKETVLQRKGPLRLRVLTDRTSCEFFLQGEISASYGQPMKDVPLDFSSADEFSLAGRRWAMQSIWG